jgi:hypothetical protein
MAVNSEVIIVGIELLAASPAPLPASPAKASPAAGESGAWAAESFFAGLIGHLSGAVAPAAEPVEPAPAAGRLEGGPSPPELDAGSKAAGERCEPGAVISCWPTRLSFLPVESASWPVPGSAEATPLAEEPASAAVPARAEGPTPLAEPAAATGPSRLPLPSFVQSAEQARAGGVTPPDRPDGLDWMDPGVEGGPDAGAGEDAASSGIDTEPCVVPVGPRSGREIPRRAHHGTVQTTREAVAERVHTVRHARQPASTPVREPGVPEASPEPAEPVRDRIVALPRAGDAGAAGDSTRVKQPSSVAPPTVSEKAGTPPLRSPGDTVPGDTLRQPASPADSSRLEAARQLHIALERAGTPAASGRTPPAADGQAAAAGRGASTPAPSDPVSAGAVTAASASTAPEGQDAGDPSSRGQPFDAHRAPLERVSGGVGSGSEPFTAALGADVSRPAVDRMAAPAPLGPSVPESPAGQDVVPQIIKGIRMQWRQGGGEARVRLDPAHLGEVSVMLKVQNGVVVALVRAENAIVQGWIDSRQQELRAALGEQGLRLEEFEVAVDPDGRKAREEAPPAAPRPRRRRSDDEAPPRFEVSV